MYLIKKFLDHPKKQKETYIEHFYFAFKSSLILFFASIACLIHSIFPFLFENTASNMTKDFLNKRFNKK
jgi:hypothetical protein